MSPDGEPVINKVFFCREKFCPTCAKRKSLKAYANGMKLSEALAEDYSFIHLVLTVKNCAADDLRDTIKMMNLKSSALFNSSMCKGVFLGVLRCLEVTVNTDSNEFHPHFHCLVAVRHSYFKSRYYISADKIRYAWADLIGQSDSVIHMSKVTQPDKAIAEICKYCVKPFDITDVKQAVSFYERLYFSTKHLRYVQSFGVIRETLRKLKIDFEEIKDTFDFEEVDLSGFDDITDIIGGGEMVYYYDHDTKRYRKFL